MCDSVRFISSKQNTGDGIQVKRIKKHKHIDFLFREKTCAGVSSDTSFFMFEMIVLLWLDIFSNPGLWESDHDFEQIAVQDDIKGAALHDRQVSCDLKTEAAAFRIT